MSGGLSADSLFSGERWWSRQEMALKEMVLPTIHDFFRRIGGLAFAQCLILQGGRVVVRVRLATTAGLWLMRLDQCQQTAPR